MQRKDKKKNVKNYDLKELEKEASVVCRDFLVFCDYIVTNEVKLSKRTGNIGKKDCFALNGLLHVREKYESPTYSQSQYSVINFFYYIAVKYKILEINSSGTGLREGKNYQNFIGASVWEQYVLFLSVFLFDGTYAEGRNSWYSNGAAELWGMYVDSFMEWLDTEKPGVGCKSRVSGNSGICGLGSMRIIMPYLEELGLVKVWGQPDGEGRDRECQWEIEVRPLLELVADLYENTDIDADVDMEGCNTADLDVVVCCAYEDYIKKLMGERPQSRLSGLFGNQYAQDRKQTIDLEVSVRYTDCIRVIRMNLEDSLYDLHMAIQEAVEFDDDHLFAFHIGDGMLKRTYAPSEAMTSGREMPVEGTRLSSLELRKGQKFTYLFDFGDSWWFDIKVLEIREGTVKAPQVIKIVNGAPQQYPDYEEDVDEWQVEISARIQVSDILTSIDDELIREEYAALMGMRHGLPKESPALMRRDMERLLLQNPNRMLIFMTAEMRKTLMELLRNEWTAQSGMCTPAKLYSFGFCQLPEKEDGVILVPEAVKEIYLSKSGSGDKGDKIAKTAEVFLGRCGVMEMKRLHEAVAGFLKSKITYEDFEYLIFSRLYYFGEYYCDTCDGTEYVSRYDRDMTWEILAERQKPENEELDYPDFEKIYSKTVKEIPEALQNWNEYINWNMNIGWQTAENLLTRIPAMAASGIIAKEEIVAVYKEMLRGTGSRMSKKAEKLIGDLCTAIPLATKKGNTGTGDHAAEKGDSGERTKLSKAEGNSDQKSTPEKVKDRKGGKRTGEDYIQLSIFDQ